MDGSGGVPVKGSGAGFEWDADSQLYYHARFPFVSPSPPTLLRLSFSFQNSDALPLGAASS